MLGNWLSEDRCPIWWPPRYVILLPPFYSVDDLPDLHPTVLDNDKENKQNNGAKGFLPMSLEGGR